MDNESQPSSRDWGNVPPNEVKELEVVGSGNAALKDLTKEAAEIRSELEMMEAIVEKKKTRYKQLCEQILNVFELMELDNLRAHGFLFYKNTQTSVQTPKTIEDKKALFEELEKRGIFYEIVSVNSQTLNKLYRELTEESDRLDFRLPGVGAPTSFTTLKLKKG